MTHTTCRSDRLNDSWSAKSASPIGPGGDAETLGRLLSRETLAEIDPFDRAQLAEVLRVCSRSRTISEAGRYLSAASRRAKTSTNDADRLRKYLARFDLRWADLT